MGSRSLVVDKRECGAWEIENLTAGIASWASEFCEFSWLDFFCVFPFLCCENWALAHGIRIRERQRRRLFGGPGKITSAR